MSTNKPPQTITGYNGETAPEMPVQVKSLAGQLVKRCGNCANYNGPKEHDGVCLAQHDEVHPAWQGCSHWR